MARPVSRNTGTVVAATLFALAICGAGIIIGAFLFRAPVTEPKLPTCAVAFVQYEVITDVVADQGCTDEKGAVRKPKVRTCKDGRRLVQMGDLIGFVGEKAQPTSQKDRALAEGLYTMECLR